MVSAHGPFGRASAAVGAPEDHIRLIFCLASAVPLGALVPLLPSSHAEGLLSANCVHAFSLVIGAWYLFGILDLFYGWLQLAEMACVTYLICAWGMQSQRHLAQRGGRQSIKFPWLVFAFAMGQLTLNHTWRYVYNVHLSTVEITGTMMVFVLKLVHFAWNLYDGQRPDTELDAVQKQTRLPEMPSFLAFLGYVFFFPSLLIGPAFTFSTYDAFASHNAYSLAKGTRQRPNALLPGRKRAAAKRGGLGLLFLGLYAVLGPKWGYERILEDQFLRKTFLERLLFTQCAGFVARTKYYGGWCLAEAGCILSGLGFNAAKGTWDATANVRIYSIEFAQNWKVLLDSWNVNTNVFLRECIYKRVAKPGKKPGFKSTMLTFGTSALWHGVNAAYYLTFLLGGFLQALCRHIRSVVRPFFLSAEGQASSIFKIAYDVASIAALQVTLNYTVIPFMVLDLRPSVVAWSRLYWYGHILTFVPLILFWAGLGKGLRKTAQKQLGGKHAQMAYDQRIKGEVEGPKGVDQLGPDVSISDLDPREELKRAE